MRTIAFLVACSTFLFGMTLEELTSRAMENNLTLKQFDEEIDSSKYAHHLSAKWANPTLGFAINGIYLDFDISKRDIESLQTQSVSITQKIPLNDRIKYEKKIATNNIKTTALEQETQKLTLISKIYSLGYQIKITTLQIEQYHEYQKNIEDLKNFATLFYEQNKISYETLIELDILEKNYQLQLQTLKYQKEILLEQLQRLTLVKVDDLEVELQKEFIPFEANIDKHPHILHIVNDIDKAQNQAQLEKAKKIDDISVTLSYFQRNRSDLKDYISLSVAIPLPIYNRENISANMQLQKKKSLTHQLEDLKVEFNSAIKVLNFQMLQSYNNYQIIKNNILVQREMLNSLYSTLNETSTNVSQIIQNHNKIVDLQLLGLKELAIFHEALADTKYFNLNKDNQ